MMKFRLNLAPVVALATGLALMSGSVRAQTEPLTAQATVVTLSSTKNLWTTLPIVAQQKGFFSAEGLNVEIDYVPAAKSAMAALVTRHTDFAAVVPIDLALLGFTGNQDPRVIATISSSANNAIVARRSAGISKPEDLKGKRLGVLADTSSQVFADRFLAKHGLPPQDVQIERLAVPALTNALAQKDADAVSIWQPLALNVARSLGAEEAVVFKDPTYRGYMNIAVSSAWLDDHKDVARTFLRALRKAELFVRAHPAEAQAIVAEQIGLAPEIVKALWGEYDFRLRLDVKGLGGSIDEESAWISRTQEAQKGKPVPDSRLYLDPKPLKSAAGR